MQRIITLVIIAAAIVACGRRPGAFPPPPQRSLDLGPDPGQLRAFIHMDDRLANEYVVRDITLERSPLRWALLNPELRFQVKETRNLKFAAEFVIPEVTFQVTGPVTVSCSLSGRPLGSIRCDHPGDYRFEKPVPEGWVKAGPPINVTFRAEPRWVSKEDGAQLSFLLRSAGFTS